MARKSNAPENFWSRVDKSADCWLWTGPVNSNGYGVAYFAGQRTTAHRASYALAFGEIPAGMFVCHKCDNPPCVRPDHLFLGTPADNSRDMVAKGRAAYPEPILDHPFIGRTMLYEYCPFPARAPENKARFEVEVKSVKRQYGRYDAVVSPVEGDGELRVQLDSLEDE